MEISEAPHVIDMLLASLLAIDKKERKMRRMHVHISELCYCLRRSYFQRVAPLSPTVTQLGFYVDGARRHDVIEPLHPGRAEYGKQKFHIIGTIDVLSSDEMNITPVENGITHAPVEIKTTRSKSSLPKDHYIRQLAFYCVLVETNYGWLIIQPLLNFDEPFHAYKIEFTAAEMQRWKEELLWRRNLLLYAYIERRPQVIPVLDAEDQWLCGTAKRKCERIQECQKLIPVQITEALRSEIMSLDVAAICGDLHDEEDEIQKSPSESPGHEEVQVSGMQSENEENKSTPLSLYIPDS